MIGCRSFSLLSISCLLTSAHLTPLGSYFVNIYFHDLYVNQRPLRLATLLPGRISTDQSHCSFTNCDKLDTSCFVSCVMRDSNGHLLREAEDAVNILLEITHVNNLNDPTSNYTQVIPLVSLMNGLYEAAFTIQIAGNALIRVQDVLSQQFLHDSFSALVLRGNVSIAHSRLVTQIPTQLYLTDSLHLEVQLADANGNLFCFDDDEAINAEVLLEIRSPLDLLVYETVFLAEACEVGDAAAPLRFDSFLCVRRACLRAGLSVRGVRRDAADAVRAHAAGWSAAAAHHVHVAHGAGEALHGG